MSYQFWAAIYDLDVQAAKKTSQTLLSDATIERPEHLLAEIVIREFPVHPQQYPFAILRVSPLLPIRSNSSCSEAGTFL